jgi:hypothetical protein
MQVERFEWVRGQAFPTEGIWFSSCRGQKPIAFTNGVTHPGTIYAPFIVLDSPTRDQCEIDIGTSGKECFLQI